jgi:hypothetical protein
MSQAKAHWAGVEAASRYVDKMAYYIYGIHFRSCRWSHIKERFINTKLKTNVSFLGVYAEDNQPEGLKLDFFTSQYFISTWVIYLSPETI